MRIRILRRHIKEGSKNIIRNGSMTLSAISAVAVTLLILGVVLVLAMNINYMVDIIENQVEILVELDMEVNEIKTDGIENEILNIEGVKSLNFVSKEQGLEDLKESLGEDGYLLEGLEEDNPLYDMFIVQVFNPQNVGVVAEKIEKIDSVISVDYGQGTVETLFIITNWVQKIGIIFIIGLAFTAMYLISNTIKITINARKTEIEIMKLVGATNGFIKWPFFIEGLLLGLLGSIIPVILIVIGYQALLGYFGTNYSIAFFELLPMYPLAYQISLLLLGIGAFIGIWGSLMSVRRFLRI